MLAALKTELGRLDEARRILTDLAGERFDFAAVPVNNDFLLSTALLAEVATACGDVQCSEGLYRLLQPHGQLNVDTLELSTGAVARYLGLLATALERDDDAARHFDQALEMNARMGAHPWLAHTQCDLARFLLGRGGRGDGDRAATLLKEASTASSELGLTALEEELQSLQFDRPARAR